VQTASALPGSDILEPYQGLLERHLELVNEIATFNNRAARLSYLVAQDSYNPVSMLDLQSSFDRLLNANEGAVSYATGRKILLDDLETCLDATSTNVTEACSPVINGGETLASAYDFYDSEHGYPECTNGGNQEACWLAQQNTIALQYSAIRTFELKAPPPAPSLFFSGPSDALYIDALPSFDGAGAPISGKAGLTTFQDAFFETANVFILPLQNDADLGDIVAKNDPALAWFDIDGEDGGGAFWSGLTGLPFAWTSPNCQPTFTNPCALDVRLEVDEETSTVNMSHIGHLFTPE